MKNSILCFLTLALFSCNDASHQTSSKDALGMMETIFKGNYTRQEIKSTLDQAMTLYGVFINEENYNRCGSVLVALRKDTNIKEMTILDYMIRSYVPNVKITFPEAAALAVTFLEAGDT